MIIEVSTCVLGFDVADKRYLCMLAESMEDSEFDMFSFFEMTPDLVCIADRDGYFKKVNTAVLKTLGYTEDELFASPISSFMHPDDREHTALRRSELLEGKALTDFDNRYISKRGETLWLHWTAIYIPDKEVVFAVAKDITGRKKAQNESEQHHQKFKGLATHFKSNIEKDRKTFAVELHEELAQLAAAIKMDIDFIKGHSEPFSAFTKSRIENASAVSQVLINKLRKLSFTISPNMLESFGLSETLELLCKEFTVVNNIACTFIEEYDESHISYEIKLDLFRICQECLKNVETHARATSVKIVLEDMGSEICLSIIDNGVGFNSEKETKTSGLINMHRLAILMNGNLRISSEEGNGTTVCFTIPKDA